MVVAGFGSGASSREGGMSIGGRVLRDECDGPTIEYGLSAADLGNAGR